MAKPKAAHLIEVETPEAEAPAPQAPAASTNTVPEWSDITLECHGSTVAFMALPDNVKRHLVAYGFSKKLQDSASGAPKRAEGLAERFAYGSLTRLPDQDDKSYETDVAQMAKFIELTGTDPDTLNGEETSLTFREAVKAAIHKATFADLVAGKWAEERTASPTVIKPAKSEEDKELEAVVYAQLERILKEEARRKKVKGFTMPGVRSADYQAASKRLLDLHGTTLRKMAADNVAKRREMESTLGLGDLDLS